VRLSEDTVLTAEVLPVGAISVGFGQVSSGYELMNAHVAVLTMRSEEDRREAHRRLASRHRTKAPAGKRLLSYAELSVGDYVVHAAHGIGIFEGIETIRGEGGARDYITIRYAGVDKLFLPADRLEMISKYIGARSEDGTVKLSKLGGVDWQKARGRAKSAARDMARELIALYAERQRRPGFAALPDGDLDAAFADAFEFEETDAQAIAIREVKGDMERPIPMDRLLCGDVGFGKTEVALRAAFKAIVSGKQVALLVPTTILALQHYQTALSRMRGFPVTVEMLSRFRTPKEQASILRRLRRGEIDLIVGTHKLLGGKVEFRDLGLLIVDEEQRFGVAQKEKLKRLAGNVDVLTLTATPIPRTLNMAMSGIRDMSILDEAPGDRFPVQTYVLEHDDAVIVEALRRELARGGQVLYLYNRVEDIDLVAGRIMRALPDARVAFAHGKMDHDELEDIWQALVRGDLDILVCTTIIETGVDLPNANTLVIENADRLGLAQLHQIRGRVGRSGRHAYAYFTYRHGKALSEVATKRLAAIREYAEFGAGFKIALRDLEIRGAGNLLGSEQHGHIDAVGYDLYIRLLSEAILEEQGKTVEPPFEATVDFKESANIPESYIRLSSQRMEMYKKISLILTEEDMADILAEFSDRFGEPPLETVRLVRLSLLRALAARARIPRIECGNPGTARSTDRLEISRPEVRFAGATDLSVWALVFGEFGGLRFGGSSSAAVTLRLRRGEDAARAALDVMLAYTRKKEELDAAKKAESIGKETSSDG
jgi:transcription-repair coupling factor (superfamily II helicase)